MVRRTVSDEIDESALQTTPAVSITVVAVDTESVKTATRLRLEIEGEPDIVVKFAELNVGYLQLAFGDGFTIVGGDGKPLGPTVIDPLAEDPPVA
jgi:hypothetical protein